VSTLEEDLSRRDFTINAMAMTIDGDLIDPFRGRDDLKNNIIQTVGDAKSRFEEDPLRMMRAVRFVSQLSFKIEPKSIDAILNLAHLLKHISIERITIEFDKLLLGYDTEKAFQILLSTGLFHHIP